MRLKLTALPIIFPNFHRTVHQIHFSHLFILFETFIFSSETRLSAPPRDLFHHWLVSQVFEEPGKAISNWKTRIILFNCIQSDLSLILQSINQKCTLNNIYALLNKTLTIILNAFSRKYVKLRTHFQNIVWCIYCVRIVFPRFRMENFPKSV